MARQVYPSDLTDAEWALLSGLLPPAKPGGRPRSVDVRRIINGLLYLVRAGCAWRYLPREYGPWSTVHGVALFSPVSWRWHLGTGACAAARTGSPAGGPRSYPECGDHRAIIESQSIRTPQGGPRGFAGGKKVWGRQRPLLVDTLGLLLKVVVHPASLHDRQGAKLVLGALEGRVPRLPLIWADQGSAGALRQRTKEHIGVTLEVVYPWWRQLKRYFADFLDDFGYQPGCNVIPRRGLVERTISWVGRARRLSKDDERLPTSSEALIYLTRIHLLLARLA